MSGSVRDEAQAIPVRRLGSVGKGPSVWYFHDEVSVGPGPVAEALADDFEVIAPIHPGFSESPRPDWVVDVEDVAELYRDRLVSDEPFVLVGSSVGAWIATELAFLLAESVMHLWLIGPIGLHVQDHPPADHWFQTDAERDAILFSDPAKKPVVEPDEYIANEAMFARLGWNPRLASRRMGPRLERLTVPTTIIWGKEDALIPPEHVVAWQEKLPQAHTITLPDSGHYPVYEQPEVVAKSVGDVVRGLNRP